MKNWLLFVASIVLISITFVIVKGGWPVVVFWVNLIVSVLAIVSDLYLIVFVPVRVYESLTGRFGFDRHVSWFAVVATSSFSYVITRILFNLFGMAAQIHTGIWDLSIYGGFFSVIVVGFSLIVGTIRTFLDLKSRNSN